MSNSILCIKGNFTSRQFEALNRIWENLKAKPKDILPIVQLKTDDDVGMITKEDNGSITMTSLFSSSSIENIEDKVGLVNKVIELLSTEDRQKIYESLYRLGCKIYK